MEIILDAIFGDKMTNEMMRACDVFPSSKRVVSINKITITKTDKDISKLISNVKETLEKSLQEVVFLGIRTIDNKINKRIKPYILNGISVVSSGEKFALFRDTLTLLGYGAEVDEHQCVTKAKLL